MSPWKSYYSIHTLLVSSDLIFKMELVVSPLILLLVELMTPSCPGFPSEVIRFWYVFIIIILFTPVLFESEKVIRDFIIVQSFSHWINYSPCRLSLLLYLFLGWLGIFLISVILSLWGSLPSYLVSSPPVYDDGIFVCLRQGSPFIDADVSLGNFINITWVSSTVTWDWPI